MVLTKVAGAVAAVALVVPAVATPASRPSERSCLIAWNGPSNAANRARLEQQPRWPSAVLVPSSIRTVGLAPATSSTAPGCSLMLSKRGQRQQVVGRWVGRTVWTWTFWPRVRTSAPVPRSNVRVLTDGRVTKIYRR